MGRKALPAYRIVVMDVRNRRDGAFVEKLGYYQPQNDPAKVDINEERALYWLSVGAQPTDTVKNLFQKAGIMKKAAEKQKSE